MADPLPLPERTLLRTVMPDDFRYGHVYGYTAGQMRAHAAAARKAALLEAAELAHQRHLKYATDMEGADYDDFIKSEWAAEAMRLLETALRERAK